MADISWDTNIPNPTSWTFGLRSNVKKNPMLYSGGVRTLGIPAPRWVFKGTWILDRAKGSLLRSLLVKLRGGGNRLLMYDLMEPTFMGVGGGTPLVVGANQTGNTLNIDGCSNNITNWALPGDKFAVNGELKLIVAAANTSGTGTTTLTFEPVLRASPADNAPLTVVSPTARFILGGPDVLWVYEANFATSSLSIEAEEAYL